MAERQGSLGSPVSPGAQNAHPASPAAAHIGLASVLDANPASPVRGQRSLVSKVASFSYKGQNSDVLLEGTPISFEKSLKSEFRIKADKDLGGARSLKYRLQDKQFPKGVVVTSKWLLERGGDAEGRKCFWNWMGNRL